MIYKAIQLIKNQLNQFIPAINGQEQVEIGNIAFSEAQDQDRIKDKMVISLVNLEEESTLKNSRSYQINNNEVIYRDHPVHMNLYILLSANYGIDKYEIALQNLSKVIEFFQSHRLINLLNAPQQEADDSVKELQLIMELFALTFEQVNYLWGSLGGKQVPFVLYKARLVVIKSDKPQKAGEIIEEITAADEAF